MTLMQKNIQELAPLLKSRELSPVELMQDCLRQIEKSEPAINAYITVLGEEALLQAAEAEREMMQGQYRGLLHGIPYSAKDLYWTKGIRTTAGSQVLRAAVPTANATVIERLNHAGAILMGKNNLHEFAYGTTNENDYFGPCRNPWDTSRITGGSSGGSAASVAALSSIFSLGTDTGGSIRIPAALCGVTGLKPTYGRVSKRGVIPLSWSHDHAGPLAKSVWDTAAVLTVIAGYDHGDPACVAKSVPDYTECLSRETDIKLNKVTIGFCPDYYRDMLQPEIEQAFGDVISWFEGQGAVIKELSYPNRDIFSAGHLITLAEAYRYHAANLEQYSDLYGSSVRQRLEKGKTVLIQDYIDALRIEQQAKRDWEELYCAIDVFLSPTTLTAAFPVGQQTISFGREQVDPRIHGVLTYLTAPSDFNGYPAISVPCGFTAEGLPIGFQIQGKPFAEACLLRLAHCYQQAHAAFNLIPANWMSESLR